MKHQLNDIPMKDKIPVVVLSSFIIGLLLTPRVYIVIIGVLGGGGGFPMAFSVLFPPLLGSMLFLVSRLFFHSRAQGTARLLLMVAEAVCWLMVGVFLFLVSGFTLLTTQERMGSFSMLLLLASVLAAPVVLLRPPVLVARVARWPAHLVLACSLTVTVTLITFAVVYAFTPARFL